MVDQTGTGAVLQSALLLVQLAQSLFKATGVGGARAKPCASQDEVEHVNRN